MSRTPTRVQTRSRPTLSRDIDDVALKSNWAALEADGIASVFQTYSWQRGLVTHLIDPANIEPIFVTVREARSNRVVALFPLQLRKRQGMRIVEYLGADFCDTCMPLVVADLMPSTATARALINALLSVLSAADMVRLAKMPRQLFGNANPFDLAGDGRPSADMTFPVVLDADRPGFVATTSAFKAYQKQWRKLSRRNGIAFELFETPGAIAAAFDAMIAMRMSRFTDLNRNDLLNDPKVAAFYRTMALLPETERVVQIAGLKVGDAYTAYIYMMDRGGKFSTVISAMDNTVGNAYAPGLILFTKIFEHAVESGYAQGDIGIGYMHYKTRFSAEPNPLFIWERGLTVKGRLMLIWLDHIRAFKHLARNNKPLRAVVEKLLGRKIGPPVATREPEPAKSGEDD